MKKSIKLSLKCPFCGKSLMDEEHLLNEAKSIKVNIETSAGKGQLWLCSIYGCYDHEANISIKENEIVNMSCPHCQTSLLRDIKCKKCDAPMTGMNIIAGGKVNICSRKGCDNHYVLFEDINDVMTLFEDKFRYLE
ncbi:MAG: hypothetical protein PHT69_11280 [Bacteroidales bacterium]|nr:hypothetical protein [Bacteroidales bacterium]